MYLGIGGTQAKTTLMPINKYLHVHGNWGEGGGGGGMAQAKTTLMSLYKYLHVPGNWGEI